MHGILLSIAAVLLLAAPSFGGSLGWPYVLHSSDCTDEGGGDPVTKCDNDDDGTGDSDGAVCTSPVGTDSEGQCTTHLCEYDADGADGPADDLCDADPRISTGAITADTSWVVNGLGRNFQTGITSGAMIVMADCTVVSGGATTWKIAVELMYPWDTDNIAAFYLQETTTGQGAASTQTGTGNVTVAVGPYGNSLGDTDGNMNMIAIPLPTSRVRIRLDEIDFTSWEGDIGWVPVISSGSQ